MKHYKLEKVKKGHYQLISLKMNEVSDNFIKKGKKYVSEYLKKEYSNYKEIVQDVEKVNQLYQQKEKRFAFSSLAYNRNTFDAYSAIHPEKLEFQKQGKKIVLFIDKERIFSGKNEIGYLKKSDKNVWCVKINDKVSRSKIKQIMIKFIVDNYNTVKKASKKKKETRPVLPAVIEQSITTWYDQIRHYNDV